MLGIEFPDTVKNYPQIPLDGTSFKHTLGDADTETAKTSQFDGLLGTRSIWKDGWKANTVHPATGGWSDFGSDKWELYNVDVDRSEMHDVAEAYPEKLREMIELWFYEAGLYNGLPIDDRAPSEMIGGTARPSLVDTTQSRYTYYPNTAMVPEGDMPSIRGRSYKFGVFVDFDDTPAGVLR